MCFCGKGLLQSGLFRKESNILAVEVAIIP